MRQEKTTVAKNDPSEQHLFEDDSRAIANIKIKDVLGQGTSSEPQSSIFERLKTQGGDRCSNFNKLLAQIKLKKGVTRQLANTLQPINSEFGGKPIQPSIFTTNGFNKIKFDNENLEASTRLLTEMFAKSKK